MHAQLQNGECIDHGFTLDNRGKQSIAVNLADPEGQQIVRDLAAKADVFLTNLLPVRLGRFGLDYPTLDATNPGIVYASVSGWGLDGPDPDRLAFDMTAFFARGGVMSMWGQPNSVPVKPRSGQGDHQTGLAAFSSILAALLLRVSFRDDLSLSLSLSLSRARAPQAHASPMLSREALIENMSLQSLGDIARQRLARALFARRLSFARHRGTWYAINTALLHPFTAMCTGNFSAHDVRTLHTM